MKKIHRHWLVFVIAWLLGLTLTACSFASPSARYVAEGDRQTAEGRTAEAILAYRQAVAHDARAIPALRKLARAYAAQGRRRLAQQYLQKAAALRPDDREIAEDLKAFRAPAAVDAPLETAWQVVAGASPPVGMAFDAQTLYIVFTDGRVAALDGITGTARWEGKLPVRASSAPAIGEGLVGVGGEDGALYTFAADDGRPRWRYQTAAPIYAAPVVTSAAIYVPSGDGSFSALDPADGKLLWKIEAVGPLTGSPAVADGVVYFGAADGRIYAADAATGQELWGSGIMAQGAVESQPTIAGGRVFVGAGDSRVYALAVATGGEYWRHSTPDAIYTRPLVISNTLYVASAGNTLSALDVLSGEVRWELTAPSALRYTPALAGATLYYVAAADPTLYGVDAATGKPIWLHDTGDWLAAGPVIADGLLYLLGQDGMVMALRLQ